MLFGPTYAVWQLSLQSKYWKWVSPEVVVLKQQMRVADAEYARGSAPPELLNSSSFWTGTFLKMEPSPGSF